MAVNKKLSPMRVAFVSLDKPMAFKDKKGGESAPKFSITCLIPKSDKAGYKEVKDYLTSCIDSNGNWKADKKKQILNKATKTVTDEGINNNCILRDGDELNKQRVIDDQQPYEFFKDHWVIKFSRHASWSPAMVVDRGAREIPQGQISGIIRPGYYVIIECSPYMYDGQNSGISLQLQGVQMFKKGEEFGRANNFTAVEGEDEEENDDSAFTE